MKSYLVEYRQTDPESSRPDIDEGFLRFQGDDVDHAIEQAEDHLGGECWDFDILSVIDEKTDKVLWKKY